MEHRANVLRDMKMCRFCLNEEDTLTNIYEKDGKQSVPLPLQIMACVAIEVFPSDGMPQLICKSCRLLTQQAYNFKTSCKKADDALKLFLATGSLAKPNLKRGPFIREEHEEFEEASVCKKRAVVSEQSYETPPKMKKLSEFGAIKYSNEVEVVNRVSSTSQEHADQKTGILDAKQPLQTTEEELEDEEEEEEEEIVESYVELEHPSVSEQSVVVEQGDLEEQEEDNINPLLKVPLVETDVFPCLQCERSFPLKQLLDIHSRNHERERSFGCDECGRRFFTKYDLGKHIQTHSDTKPFTCVVCQKQFARESLLHRHEKIHIDVPKYLCTFCDRTYLTKEDLDAHSEKHKKKRPFACRLCNKSFVFKQGLERHELTHADQKPHKCNYCEASFTSAIKLTRHITSHAGLRPYPCKMCGRTFLLSHHLTRHMRSHYAAKSSNVPPIGQYKCDVCSMSFKRKDSLINHSAIHSMVNLKCVICNTAFDSAKMVKEHITTHLSGLPYTCERCDYSFETQTQLEEHEMKHAEMEYEEQIEKEVSMEVQQQQQHHYHHRHHHRGGEDPEDDDEEDLEDEDEEENEEDEEDEYNTEEEEIVEFTITNPDNPEVVRRSKRATKIKNYAQFLQDKLSWDMEEEAAAAAAEQEMADEESGQETIKPVVRTEGTKVYTRKSAGGEKPKTSLLPAGLTKPELDMEMASVDQQVNKPQLTLLEDLGIAEQAANALSNKKFVDMRIGDKKVRVQKLMMTRAEIEVMARQGKIEMKGNTLLLRNTGTNVPQSASKSAGEETTDTFSKQLIKKTYVRKVAAPGPKDSGPEPAGTADQHETTGQGNNLESITEQVKASQLLKSEM